MLYQTTHELARRLEQSEIELLRSRLIGIQSLPKNPVGVDIKPFGNAVAFSVQNIPSPSFNTVKGMTADNLTFVDSILNFFEDRKSKARFEVTPAHGSRVLFSRLHTLGFYQQDFHTTLYQPLTTDLEDQTNYTDLEIRDLREDEFNLFAEIYTKGFGMPEAHQNGVAENNQVLYNDPNWHFYLALLDGEPAGIGVLFMKGMIATLAAAAVLPGKRDRGIHSALIKHRIHEATLRNCTLCVGQARFGSTSQTNMEKSGFRIAYTKSIWGR